MKEFEKTIIIDTPERILHFCGQYAEGYFVICQGKKTLITDSRYFYAVKNQLSNSDVEVLNGDYSTLCKILNGEREVGIDYTLTTVNFYNKLAQIFDVFDASALINEHVSVKSQEQLSLIAKSCEIAENAFNETLNSIKLGISELEVSAELEYNFKKHGASGPSFETIVAFGKNSAVPHHRTGETRLEANSVILIDFGCKFGGFCSDMTRTMFFGEPTEKFLKAYASVDLARREAFKNIKSGILGRVADAFARDSFKKDGFDEFFTHSLGHGIGTFIHENPTLSPRGNSFLSDGNVFSIEPGIYFDGEFGIRTEDTVCLDDGKVKSFMKIGGELRVLN